MRNKGLKGKDLLKYKYNYLTERGIPAKYAPNLGKTHGRKSILF